MDFGTANEGAQNILAEARAVAEQKIKENLPELPVEIPSSLRPEKSAGETS